MIEIITAMTIVGVLATVAVPRFADRGGFDDAAVVDQMRASLRYAQRLAAARNRVVCVSVTANGVNYFTAREPGTSAACLLPVTATGGDSIDVQMPAALALAPQLSFRILPDGQLADAGLVSLSRPAQQITVLRNGEQTGAITLHTENGFAL